MHWKLWKLSGLALVLALVASGVVHAQQRQHLHQRGMPASQEPAAKESPESPAQGPMMQHMQGMMEDMQGMMQQMQGMMGRRGGMMGRRGGMMGMMGRDMMAEDDEEDDEEDGPGGMMRMMGRGMMGHGHGMLRKLEHLAEQLELTADQQTQVRALLRTHMKEAIQAKADIAVQRIDLLDMLDAESVDLPKVKELLHTIASQRADLMFAHITLMEEVNKLLSSEQQQQFRTMRRQMMHGRGAGMGGGGMRGRGARSQ